jgi:UDP-glucose 4-epimerase
MTRAIIIGADGFVGSHLTQRLRNENIDVWAVVLPRSPLVARIKSIPGVHILEHSIEELNSSCMPDEADVLYYLAWQGVSPEERNEFDLQFKNIDLSIRCLRIAADIGVKKVIFPGSTSEYMFYGKPIDSSAAPSVVNAYGSVKAAVRYLCGQYAEELGIGFIYTVITGIYAADRIDNNVLNYTIKCLLREEKPILTGLEQLWDYVHIDDVMDAMYLIGEKGIPGSFYCIGHGDNQPLLRYIEAIRDIINPSLPLGIGEKPYPSGRIPSSCVDLSTLCIDTGFKPKIPFRIGIKEVINRIQNEQNSHLNGNR